MPLTSAEIDQARRFCGYPVSGPLAGEDVVTQASSIALDATLASLTDDQLATIRNVYLANLVTLETALSAMSDDLDLAKAAVFTRNPVEQAERETLFASTRMKLCYYLGVAPGPAILATVLTGFAGGNVGGNSSAAFAPSVFTV